MFSRIRAVMHADLRLDTFCTNLKIHPNHNLAPSRRCCADSAEFASETRPRRSLRREETSRKLLAARAVRASLLFGPQKHEHHVHLSFLVQVLEPLLVGQLVLDLGDLLHERLALPRFRSHLFAEFLDLLMNFACGSLRLVRLRLMLADDFFRLRSSVRAAQVKTG